MSPRSTIENEKIRSQSIAKIVDAAYRLMSQKGYESTSISQIAKEAGISKGLMYNYFNSKEELLKELINNTMEEGDRLMADIISEEPAEMLSNIFKWYFNELRNNMEQWRFLSELMFKVDKFPFVKELAQSKMNEYVGFIGSLLKQMGFENPKEEAQLIAGLFDGIGFQYLVLGKEYPLDEMEKFLNNKYCKHE
jgi:AcrR family transcriptional regulator